MGWMQNDPGPAKGCLNGFLFAFPLWLVVLLLIWWIGA